MHRSDSVRRIPSLDGLRAVSISLVIFSHLCGTRHFLPLKELGHTNDLGNLGVRIFFVISGYLITGLLLKELDRTGGISLCQFYARRTLRIFPAAFAFLFAVTLLQLPLKPGDMLHAVTYTSNYHPNPAWTLGHLWSLSVEEQFYLLWPTVLVLFGRKKGLLAALCAVAAAPIIRVADFYIFALPGEVIGRQFQTAMDAIAVGCLLAGGQKWLSRSPQYLALLRSFGTLLLAPLLILLNFGPLYPRVWLPCGETVINVAIAILIDRFVRFPVGLLNHPVLVWIGVRSYSLYLWQQIFLNRTAESWWTAFPANLLLAVVAAMASYSLIEQPFLAMRGRVSRFRLKTAAAIE